MWRHYNEVLQRCSGLQILFMLKKTNMFISSCCIHNIYIRLIAIWFVTWEIKVSVCSQHSLRCDPFDSALLGFLLLLATAKLKSGFSLEHFRVWIFMSKVHFYQVFSIFFPLNVRFIYTTVKMTERTVFSKMIVLHWCDLLFNNYRLFCHSVLPGYCYVPLSVYFLYGH